MRKHTHKLTKTPQTIEERFDRLLRLWVGDVPAEELSEWLNEKILPDW